jgi:hypothetical protein
MRNFNLLSIAVALFFVATACSKQENGSTYSTPQNSEVLPQYNDRMEVIAKMSSDYEQSILEALSERNRLKSSGNTSALDVEQRIKTLFSEKCSKYPNVETQAQTKSGASEVFFIDPQKLQDKLDELSALFEDAMETADEDISKEELLAKLQKVSDSFCATVVANEALLDVEKQQIRENIVFRTSIALTSVKYADEVVDLQLLETKGCNWWCKAKKAVKCTCKSAYAAVVCAAAGITTYYSGVNPVVIGAWGSCFTAAYDAWQCWK